MRIVVLTIAMLMLASCGRKLDIMKSPCAGAEESPCGPKRPVNDWWQKGTDGGNAQV